MSTTTTQFWNRLRSIIKDCLTFAEIKDAAGRGGLPLEMLAHLQQRQLPQPSASKSELLDEIGLMLAASDEMVLRETVTALIQKCCKKHPDRRAEIESEVNRCGFATSIEMEQIPSLRFAITDPSGKPKRAATIATAPSVFVSYSHTDSAFKLQFEKHLKALSFAERVTFWSDSQIKPGQRWFEEINRALNAATVAVLLVSSDFLASDFIRENELQPILKKHRQGTINLLWVPIRACNWEETELRDIQSVDSKMKPLAEMKAERDRAWVKICKAIKAVAEK